MGLRKSVGILVVTFFVGAGAFADEYGTAGCGLGSLVFGNNPNWIAQTAAATTNGTAFTQGFGITSGTSNCLEGSDMAMIRAQEHFVMQNLRELSKEIAQGEGQTLKAFSMTFNCEQNAYPRFSSQLKKSYGRIFAAPGAAGVLDAVRSELASDEVLSSACRV